MLSPAPCPSGAPETASPSSAATFWLASTALRSSVGSSGKYLPAQRRPDVGSRTAIDPPRMSKRLAGSMVMPLSVWWATAAASTPVSRPERLDGRANLDPDAQHFRHREPLPLHALGQVRLRVVHHHDVRPPVRRRARRVDGHDVRMLEPGHRVRLGREPGRLPRRQPHLAHDFDRHLARRHALLVEVHVGVPARAELSQELQPGDLGGGRG